MKPLPPCAYGKTRVCRVVRTQPRWWGAAGRRAGMGERERERQPAAFLFADPPPTSAETPPVSRPLAAQRGGGKRFLKKLEVKGRTGEGGNRDGKRGPRSALCS